MVSSAAVQGHQWHTAHLPCPRCGDDTRCSAEMPVTPGGRRLPAPGPSSAARAALGATHGAAAVPAAGTKSTVHAIGRHLPVLFFAPLLKCPDKSRVRGTGVSLDKAQGDRWSICPTRSTEGWTPSSFGRNPSKTHLYWQRTREHRL